MLEVTAETSTFSSSFTARPVEGAVSWARGWLARPGLMAGSLMLEMEFLAGTSCSQQPSSVEKL